MKSKLPKHQVKTREGRNKNKFNRSKLTGFPIESVLICLLKSLISQYGNGITHSRNGRIGSKHVV